MVLLTILRCGRNLRRVYIVGAFVIEHQDRLANVVIDLYGSLAVLSRATSAIARLGAEKAGEEVRLAKAFVRGAKYRMVGQLKEMDKNRDAEQTAISETAYSSLGYAFPLWE